MCLVFFGASATMAAPKSEYWPAFDRFTPQSTFKVDHSSWGDFLKKYLHMDGHFGTYVAYADVEDDDRRKLDEYIDRLTALDPGMLNRSEAKAYWINLYNALTVQLILRHYPVETIRDIHEGWFAFGPWDDIITTVSGQPLTLNDIEHRILRPLWQDYRIHFAVNCASLGCPDLSPVPYEASHLDEQLDAAERRFLAQKKAVHREGDGWQLSSLFDWYAEDFGGRAGVTRLILKHHPEWVGRLEPESPIDFDYDWRLNQWPMR